MTMYKENGYSNREDYLKSLAEDFDMEYEDVLMLATTLGRKKILMR